MSCPNGRPKATARRDMGYGDEGPMVIDKQGHRARGYSDNSVLTHSIKASDESIKR